nr:MJ0042-type zinc finger domain-containing protein [Pseudomonas sp. 30_B]
MSDSFITQCPHCQTRFRVNSAQLGAASGAVRCGTCLKVFNAPQNMLGEPTQAPILTDVAPPPASPPKPAPAPAPMAEAVAPAPIPSVPEPSPVPAAAAVAAAAPEQPKPLPVPGTATLGWPLAPQRRDTPVMSRKSPPSRNPR